MSYHFLFVELASTSVSPEVTLLAARFAIYLLDMLAKLKGDPEISTNDSISPISK